MPRLPGRLLWESLAMRASIFSGVWTFAEQKILELVPLDTLVLDSALPIPLVRSSGSHGRILRKRGVRGPRHWAHFPFTRPCPRSPSQIECSCVFSMGGRLTGTLFWAFSSLASSTSVWGSAGWKEHKASDAAHGPEDRCKWRYLPVSYQFRLASFLNSLIQIHWKHWNFTCN